MNTSTKTQAHQRELETLARYLQKAYNKKWRQESEDSLSLCKGAFLVFGVENKFEIF